MSLARTIARNTFYQIAGKVASTILGLATVALMTRYLGQEGFGYYTAIVSYLQFFGVLIDFGLQMTTAQMLARPGVNQAKIFGNIMSLRLISAFLFLGLGTVLAWFLPYPETVKVGIVIASASFFFISLQSVLIGLYQKQMAMAQVALAEVWGRLVLLIGVWLAIAGDYGLYPIIAAVSLGSLVNFAFLFFGSFKQIKYKLALDKKTAREVWDVSWPLAITISLTLVYFRCDTIIMSFVRPANEVGIYGAAYKVLEILVQFPYLFLGLILPVLTSFYSINRALFDKVLAKAFDFMAIIAIPMVVATWVIGDKVMEFVAGSEFVVASGPLSILIVATAMIYFGALFGYGIVAIGKQKRLIRFYLFDAVFSLIAYLIFIPLYSYWAAAVLTVITEAIIMVSAWWVLRQEAGFRIHWGAFGKALLASLAMAMFLEALSDQSLITLVLIGSIIYFVCLYLLRGIKKEDILELVKLRS
ncbi:MAG: Polysaccharide biosynthesis protein [Parcubacteria group bacterium ADurb.Bin326]|nr:MAG: Polysaccharide biosynthesis protein [Parcubacteria group bacterium ADurb.Bin326]